MTSVFLLPSLRVLRQPASRLSLKAAGLPKHWRRLTDSVGKAPSSVKTIFFELAPPKVGRLRQKPVAFPGKELLSLKNPAENQIYWQMRRNCSPIGTA